jgi:hypothetical protein
MTAPWSGAQHQDFGNFHVSSCYNSNSLSTDGNNGYPTEGNSQNLAYHQQMEGGYENVEMRPSVELAMMNTYGDNNVPYSQTVYFTQPHEMFGVLAMGSAALNSATAVEHSMYGIPSFLPAPLCFDGDKNAKLVCEKSSRREDEGIKQDFSDSAGVYKSTLPEYCEIFDSNELTKSSEDTVENRPPSSENPDNSSDRITLSNAIVDSLQKDDTLRSNALISVSRYSNPVASASTGSNALDAVVAVADDAVSTEVDYNNSLIVNSSCPSIGEDEDVKKTMAREDNNNADQ